MADANSLFIEPCCYRKQLGELVHSANVVHHFFTNGDVTLAMFLDYFVGITPGASVGLSLIRVEQSTLDMLSSLMKRTTEDGEPWIASLTLITTGQDRAAVSDALGAFRTSNRLTVCEEKVAFRCLTVANEDWSFVLHGSIGQSSAFSVQLLSLDQTEDSYRSVDRLFGVKRRHKIAQDS
jgi:hypothetical protein